jgi:hypothetical protein
MLSPVRVVNPHTINIQLSISEYMFNDMDINDFTLWHSATPEARNHLMQALEQHQTTSTDPRNLVINTPSSGENPEHGPYVHASGDP